MAMVVLLSSIADGMQIHRGHGMVAPNALPNNHQRKKSWIQEGTRKKMNKYNKATTVVDGKEIDLSNRVFIPREENGSFKTFDGQEYTRDKNGCIRKVVK